MQTAPAPAATNHHPKPAANGQLDYRNPASDELLAGAAASRAAVVSAAQPTVVELLDLYHAAKQSHWNIQGPLFSALHETLQDYADTFLTYADLLAERIRQVGQAVDGRPSAVVVNANLGEFPAGLLPDRQVLEVMAERINTVSERVRERIGQLSRVDEVTANKLQDLGYELDKQVWQLRAHLQ